MIQPVEQLIHHERRCRQRKRTVERLGQIVEHDAGQRDDEQVDRQHDLAETGRAEAAAQQSGCDIGAARRAPGQEHKADAKPDENAAIEAVEQNFRFRRGDKGEQIDEYGAQQHPGQRTEQKFSAKLLCAEDKQRYVQKHGDHADLAEAQKLAQDHRQTAHAADVQIVRLQKQIEAECENGAAKGDLPSHLPDGLERFTFQIVVLPYFFFIRYPASSVFRRRPLRAGARLRRAASGPNSGLRC